MKDKANPASGCTGPLGCWVINRKEIPMTREIKIVEGLVARDIFGSWDDCSPGLYVDSDTVETLFSGYEGKRVRITIEEVDLRPNASVSISGDEPEYAPGDCWVHYAHKQDPSGVRFRQYAKDPLPHWAVDVQPCKPNVNNERQL